MKTASTVSGQTVIGGFRVLERIEGGAGSQGSVVKAVCVEDVHGIVKKGTVVALKIMHVSDEDDILWEKLQKRTKELCSLKSDNIVRYYGCFKAQQDISLVHVIVQEYLEGETLKARLVKHPKGLDVDEGLDVAKQVVSGLSYAADRGIIHRDVKPGNIFLCLDSNRSVIGVKLIDFEISRRTGGTVTTASGLLRGTFDYMAPEFKDLGFRGDEQSDIFSMGAVLHEIFAGRLPYDRLDGDERNVFYAFLERWKSVQTTGESPLKISGRIDLIMSGATAPIKKALAFNREDRYQNFASLRADLNKIRFGSLESPHHSYRILQWIGEGGFGVVFKGRDRKSGRLVAIKRLVDPKHAERFYREAKIVERLDDPCFVNFVEFFEQDNGAVRSAYLVMDFLDGMPGNSLRDAIKRGGDKETRFRNVLRAFMRYARGLKALHNAGIIHRDIKPSNLYYPEGYPERAAIMDLGVALDVNGTITNGKYVPGTPDYMPPEVVVRQSEHGEKGRGDAGMDIFALGLSLYEAISGRPAYPKIRQDDYNALFERSKSMIPPTFDDRLVLGNRALLRLLKDMTEPDCEKRIQDADEVYHRLEEIARKIGIDGRKDNDKPVVRKRPEEPSSIGKAVFVVSLVIFMVAAGVFLYGLMGSNKPHDSVGPNKSDTSAQSTSSEGGGKGSVTNWRDAKGENISLRIQLAMAEESNDEKLKKLEVLSNEVAQALCPDNNFTEAKYLTKKEHDDFLKEINDGIEKAAKEKEEAEREAERQKNVEALEKKVKKLLAKYDPTAADNLVKEIEAAHSGKNKFLEEGEYKKLIEQINNKILEEKVASLKEEVDKLLVEEPVADRQERLSSARGKINDAKFLNGQECTNLLAKVDAESSKVVGYIINSCSFAVKIGEADVTLKSGEGHVVQFITGKTPKPWFAEAVTVTKSYEDFDINSLLGEESFEGKVIKLENSNFKFRPVAISLPTNLQEGVECWYSYNQASINSELASKDNPPKLPPGTNLWLTFKRKGYYDIDKDQNGKYLEFKVPQGGGCFPTPPKEWQPRPVQYKVPNIDGYRFERDDKKYKNGDVIPLDPCSEVGTNYTIRIIRDDYEPKSQQINVVPTADESAKDLVDEETLKEESNWKPSKELCALRELESAVSNKNWSIAMDAKLLESAKGVKSQVFQLRYGLIKQQIDSIIDSIKERKSAIQYIDNNITKSEKVVKVIDELIKAKLTEDEFKNKYESSLRRSLYEWIDTQVSQIQTQKDWDNANVDSGLCNQRKTEVENVISELRKLSNTFADDIKNHYNSEITERSEKGVSIRSYKLD